MVRHLENSKDFSNIINEKDVLVDFYADWCGPCKMLAPILEQIDSIDVLKINVDEFPDLAAKFGVMSIPTLIVMKNGKMASQAVGVRPKSEILSMLEE